MKEKEVNSASAKKQKLNFLSAIKLLLKPSPVPRLNVWNLPAWYNILSGQPGKGLISAGCYKAFYKGSNTSAATLESSSM